MGPFGRSRRQARKIADKLEEALGAGEPRTVLRDLDAGTDRVVVLLDLHRGTRDGTDDFRR